MGNEGRPDVLKRGVIHEQAFSLIEMMITIGIFAILVMLAMPAMNRWIADVKVRSTADALQNGLRMAQAESLRRSRQVVFSLTNGATPKWSINTIPSMTDGTETAQLIESGTLTTTASGVSITPSATSSATICFNSLGRLVANTTANCALPGGTQKYSITLSAADRPLEVDVALGGQVHMCDPAKTLSPNNPDGC
jgi:type IV fimbrial biogenesis protein FimT